MDRVGLYYGIGPARVACLGSVAGHDEQAGANDATALIDRILIPAEGCIPPGAARSLPLSDRDHIARVVHTRLFGDAVTADTRCDACCESYEIRFSLAALAANRQPERPDGVEDADDAGWFRMPNVVRFRLPTQADFDAVVGLAPAEAVAALRMRQSAGDADAAEAAMRALCPVLDCDLDAPCPHCRSTRAVRFSMTRYLEQSLAAERPLLIREAHCLARAYGWSHESIMRLPRTERRAFAGLLTAETAAPAMLRRSA
jgi:hypothetical protein